MAVVTMGGPTGGGALLIGPLVAQKLGADYVDRMILVNTARRLNTTVEALHQRDERPPSRGERFNRFLLRTLERFAVGHAGGDPYLDGTIPLLTEQFEDLPHPLITRGHELEDEKYVEGLRAVMEELADKGDMVIVGRGGSIILRDNPGALRVGVVASRQDCVARIMEREKISQEEAEKTIKERDDARRYHFKRLFGIDDPDNPELYHLVLNMSEMSLDYAAELVARAAKALEEGKLRKGDATPVASGL